MTFFVENWYILFALVVAALCVGIAIYRFWRLPTEEQMQQVREWLLWAVTAAEQELGGGTGQLKLRRVYDLFVQRFSWLAKVISFDCFAGLVDEALEKMREMLEQSPTVQALVYGADGGAANGGV